ncbi:MAG: 50S ribosomal protein L23 [Candidatus Colwellbacteria bacterium]|nr:50S ribosomal protein L23 [Candidatus Colwellbacteria bacterium]
MPADNNLIKKPLISEKGTELAGLNKYIFLVQPGANKTQVKKAVESIYKVNVTQVNIVRNRQKEEGYKKAIVTLHSGQAIDIVPH